MIVIWCFVNRAPDFLGSAWQHEWRYGLVPVFKKIPCLVNSLGSGSGLTGRLGSAQEYALMTVFKFSLGRNRLGQYLQGLFHGFSWIRTVEDLRTASTITQLSSSADGIITFSKTRACARDKDNFATESSDTCFHAKMSPYLCPNCNDCHSGNYYSTTQQAHHTAVCLQLLSCSTTHTHIHRFKGTLRRRLTLMT